FADCDLAAAAATSIRSSFANQGQICLCGSRIFTGGTATGRQLARTAAPLFKKLSLELGRQKPQPCLCRLRPGRRRRH
ncbi:aldehyde dehydrogenase family protein, partial [Hymenobacter glacialis]|uniref:aldehyde dehydrogenase family protein n=1 Tax=Hymenobacter glacialis TaxID=1908236 RepID=UPI000AD3C3F5